jgi:putative aminopeptidase FrvX
MANLIISKTNKGSLLISFDKSPELIAGHIDTLRALVKEIKQTALCNMGGGLAHIIEESMLRTFRQNIPEHFIEQSGLHVNKEIGLQKRSY